MGGRDHRKQGTQETGRQERAPRYRVGRARVVERLSPTMTRVVVEGLPGFPTRHAVGETVRVVLPDPETGRVPEPDLTGGKPRWAKPAPLTRKYTVRRVDPGLGTVEIAVVAHGQGPGSRWAQALAPGDPVHLLGPKSGREAPEPGRFLLMVGDETGLPGIARWLEQLPADAVGRVILEVPGPDSVQDLSAPAGVRLTWLVPGEDGPDGQSADGESADGRPGDGDGAASRGASPEADARANTGVPDRAEVLAGRTALEVVERMPVPEGPAFAWLAGESAALRPVRRLLLEQWGLDKRSMHAKGYWTRKR
ncbi:siderophore-interacting protein [Rothia kristinae]|uniref:Siderophore-interacting protein n=1 Tax=Rothia kristinae TaxID=37923 RepID=A0A7T3CHA0_9MICC|nr:siderophore-interacting protein [Rothia kristinae]QPT54139.1 siderophore-interacting protein [Rothia kristinae]